MTVARQLGVDVGGTFTDLALIDGETGRLAISKVLTTPSDPARAVVAGSSALLKRHGSSFAELTRMVHATTLVANLLIEQAGAKVAMITTEGFIDCLETGVENRYDLFDLFMERPTPYAPRRLRFGISERTASDGTRLRPVERMEIEGIVARLCREEVQAVAVCLLNAFSNPQAEREVRALLSELTPDMAVTLSSDIAPEIREYQRASTAVANAYVQPMVRKYLAQLETRLRDEGLRTPLFIMLSEGGINTVATALSAPIRLVESGPSAGAMAAAALSRQLDIRRALAFDMGGTTAKLCIILDGEPLRTYTTEVARIHRFKRGSGVPLKIPAVELIEIGAGGGSIAQLTESGLLRVGPRSAGADPGPACYALGGSEPTITDADLITGYIDPDAFLGGRMRLDVAAAESAMTSIGERLGRSVQETAVAIQEIVNENMALAARMHAVERGEDPRRFTLIAFGGAGPVHAWRVASLLKIKRIIVPAGAGVTSAAGLLLSPPSIEISASRVGRCHSMDFAEVDRLLGDLERQTGSILTQAGVAPEDVQLRRFAECRYVGQAYEVQVTLPDGPLKAAGAERLATAFEDRYRELYGRVLPGGVVEALTWRVQALGPAIAKGFRLERPERGGSSRRGERDAYFTGVGFLPCAVHDRYALRPGDELNGPVLIEEDETTSVVGPGAKVTVDEALNLVISLG